VEIGTRRGERTHLGAQLARHGVVWTPHADGRSPRAVSEHDVDAGEPRQDDRETAGPEAGHERPRPVVDLCEALRLLYAFDENWETHIGGPSLGFEEPGGGAGYERVDGDAVDGVGRDGDDQTTTKSLDGRVEGMTTQRRTTRTRARPFRSGRISTSANPASCARARASSA